MTGRPFESDRATNGEWARRAFAAIVGVVAVVVAVHAADRDDVVTIREDHGTVTVAAWFAVDQAIPAVMAVLTDYEQIPRFLPDVLLSVVRERRADETIVEQEAVSSVLMFSKKVHLVLEIREGPDTITFRDRCGRSFGRYDGAWLLSTERHQTVVRYELTAEPSFDVPGFMLKRLLRRNSEEMIARIRREIAARATAQHSRPDSF